MEIGMEAAMGAGVGIRMEVGMGAGVEESMVAGMGLEYVLGRWNTSRDGSWDKSCDGT